MTVGGDIILSIMGKKIDSEESVLSLREKMKSLNKGDKMTLKVMRGGRVVDLNYTIPN